MIIEQIYTGCLFQASYYIESNGESAIIDPIREVDLYIDKARNNKSKIKYVFETHFHADFVSGHLTLSKKTNSKIHRNEYKMYVLRNHIVNSKKNGRLRY